MGDIELPEDILLYRTYTEAAILDVKKTVEAQALHYRNLYTKCSMMLEKLVDKFIEQNILQREDFVGKKAGEY